MHAPQVIILVWFAFEFGASVIKHGEPKKGVSNAMVDLISIGLILTLCWWGGFFSR